MVYFRYFPKVFCVTGSCYKTGELPEIRGILEDFDITDWSWLLPASRSEHFQESFEQACRWRKSCYETGQLPADYGQGNVLSGVSLDLDAGALNAAFDWLSDAADSVNDVVNTHLPEPSVQIKCHYRTSCYETGKVPELKSFSLHDLLPSFEHWGSGDSGKFALTEQQRCRYRKSCYSHVVEEAKESDKKDGKKDASAESEEVFIEPEIVERHKRFKEQHDENGDKKVAPTRGRGKFADASQAQPAPKVKPTPQPPAKKEAKKDSDEQKVAQPPAPKPHKEKPTRKKAKEAEEKPTPKPPKESSEEKAPEQGEEEEDRVERLARSLRCKYEVS